MDCIEKFIKALIVKSQDLLEINLRLNMWDITNEFFFLTIDIKIAFS